MPVVLIGDTLTFLTASDPSPPPDNVRACGCVLCDPRLVHAADWHADGETSATPLPSCPRRVPRAQD
jgi:hypothetical protein